MHPGEGSLIVDGTAGAGGHAAALRERVGASGRVIGLDRDPAMLALADRPPAGCPSPWSHAAYSDVGEVLDELVAWTGRRDLCSTWASRRTSSPGRSRGFSFAADGPLDMRFDPEADGPTAADLVNTLGRGGAGAIFL